MHPSDGSRGTVTVERDGAVARVWLDRPETRNALTAEGIAELTEALVGLGTEPGIRAIVLGGRGPAFCAGADASYMRDLGAADRATNLADAGRLAALFAAVRDCPRPVVARVHGAAMGGGVGLVAAADIAVAADDAVFALPEVRLGLVPAVISPFVVPRIGLAASRELFLTGEGFGATRALAVGLVARVVPAAELDAAVAERVEALLRAGPEAQTAAKQVLRAVAADPPDLQDRLASIIAERRASAEGREGLGAFLERRRPAWLAGPEAGA